jgi:lysophospholipase L1-like esterase
MPGRGALIVLVVSGVLLAGAVGEVGLRAYGFRFQTFPAVQFGWPEPTEIEDVYTPDRDLFWVTRDYAAKLAEAHRSPPAVVFTGDSCTEFGTWPELTLALLAARDPSLAHGVKLAVGGWSSEQGLRQLRRDVLPLRPRVLIIYFGWNDHWMAFGRPDAEVHEGAAAFWLTQHSRLMQLVVKSRLGTEMSRSGEESSRVPRDRYRFNLDTMGRLAHDAGIRPVFITAPSGHEIGREPDYLARRHIRHLADLVPLHASYVQATREAAAAAGAELCDAAAEFTRLPGAPRQYFTHDGIHFSDRGSRALADIVTNCLTPSADPQPDRR